MISLRLLAALGVVGVASLAACGGGGSSSGSGSMPPASNPAATPAPTQTTSTQQVVSMALPSSAIGSLNDPTFGVIGGFTQTTYSQTLAFAPGMQIMIRNGQSNTPHTFNVISTTAFTPGSPSTSAAGGSTISSGFATGPVSPSTTIGPFTLSAGLFYIACAFHYTSDNMRTVLNVAANAAPGPQATPPPAAATPPPNCVYCY